MNANWPKINEKLYCNEKIKEHCEVRVKKLIWFMKETLDINNNPSMFLLLLVKDKV